MRYTRIKQEGEIAQDILGIIKGMEGSRDHLVSLYHTYRQEAEVCPHVQRKHTANVYACMIDKILKDPRVDWWADGSQKRIVYYENWQKMYDRKCLLDAKKTHNRRYELMDMLFN